MSSTNPAERHVDAAQREAGLNMLKQLLQKAAGAQQKAQANHTPIVKALERIGVRVRTMAVMIGDMPVESLVIPIAELVQKEYEFMTGVQVGAMLDKAEEDIKPNQQQQQGEAGE